MKIAIENLTAETIVKRETFDYLYSIPEPLDRKEKETEIRYVAKKLNMFAEFEKMYKHYKIQKAREMTPKSVQETRFTSQPARIFCGDWIADDTGVIKNEFNYKNYEVQRIEASRIPIMPVEVYDNMDTGIEKVKIAFNKEGWRDIIVERETISNQNKIVGLSSLGIEVISGTTKHLVQYLYDCITLNTRDTLPRCKSVSRMGWVGNDFMPYNQDIRFDGEKENKYIYKAIHKKGSQSEWIKTMSKLRENIQFRLLLNASFASVLLSRLSALPFVFHIWGGTGAGKAQPLTTKIITPDGYKFMKDIRIGDKVIGGDGKGHNVIGVYPQGEKEIFEITFKDGTKTKCCKEHLWNVTTITRRNHNRGYITLSLGDMLKKPIKTKKNSYNYAIPVCKPVEYSSIDNLPIDAYLLGCLIGDGCLTLTKNRANGSHNIYFSNSEEDIINRVENELKKNGAKLNFNKATTNQFTITHCDYLKEKIRELNLNVKSSKRFIPELYKKASINNRKKMLAGLIDTDGSVSENGSISYCTKSEFLARDICELVRSLGYRVTHKKNKRDEYIIVIIGDIINLLSNKHKTRYLKSKKNKKREESKNKLSIISIEKIGKENCQCIMVDSEEQTYLCDDFIVTHNTVGLMCAASIWGNPAMGKMTRTMNMTANSMLSTAAFLHDIPFIGDELQTIKSRWENYDSLIMKITEGIDRGRMQYDRVLETKTWNCSFLFSGEEPCTKLESGGGVINRVINVECTEALITNGNEIVRFISENYGHAGELFVNTVKNLELQTRFQEIYTKILEECKTTEKQALSMANILLADEITSNFIFVDKPLEIKSVVPYLASVDDVDVAERAYEYLISLIASCINNFYSSKFTGECWGKIEECYIWFNKQIMIRELNKVGYSFEALKKKWVEKKYIEKDSQGKYQHQRKINGVNSNFIKIVFINDKNPFEDLQ